MSGEDVPVPGAQVLHAREMRLAALLSSVEEVVFELDADGTYLNVWTANDELLIRPRHELLGARIGDFFDAELTGRALTAIRSVLRSGKPETLEYSLAGDDTRWFRGRLRRVPSSDGPPETVALAVRDITESHLRERALRDSELKLRHLADAAFDGLVVAENGRIVEGTDKFAGQFGYSLEDMLGAPIVQLIDPASRADVTQKIQSGYSRPYETTGLRSSGESFPFEVCGRTYVREGRTLRVAAIRDLTERKRVEAEILQARKIESLGVLAGGIAHDFNNLLTAIIGSIHLAKSYATPRDEIHELLVTAEKASVRAAQLTQQLLTFSRGGEPVKAPVLLAETIHDATTFAATGSAVDITLDIAADLCPVNADKGQMSQVLHNLTLNAVQASSDGATVLVAADNTVVDEDRDLPLPSGTYVRIAVHDRGVGIPVETLASIFDPYFSTKPGGRGLGLAVAFSIIDHHDGHIAVDTEPGRGTTFSLYLPATDVMPPAPAPAPAEATRVTESIKVLLMDDQELVRLTAAAMLRGLGYAVEVAHDGAHALELFERAQTLGDAFDLVIMDLTVRGGLGGRETIGKLLELDPAAKAIASSGYSTDPIMANFADFGFAGCLPKPYTTEDIRRLVDRVLER